MPDDINRGFKTAKPSIYESAEKALRWKRGKNTEQWISDSMWEIIDERKIRRKFKNTRRATQRERGVPLNTQCC